jgi:hypothetical protein
MSGALAAATLLVRRGAAQIGARVDADQTRSLVRETAKPGAVAASMPVLLI